MLNPSTAATAADMMPVRRDLRFSLEVERARDWHGQGMTVTHFFNALSLLFPAGERFFMDSVRNYRDRIKDPVLKQQVLGFIGQEAMHTREHVEYNEALEANQLPARKLDRRVWRVVGAMKCVMPHSMRLANTVALEHYTAMLGGLMLDDPWYLSGSEDGYKQIWLWHALEETEHKAVAFDVWNAVMEPGAKRYLLRVGMFLIITLTFWPGVFLLHTRLIRSDRHADHRVRGMWRMIKFLYGPRKGMFPRMASQWFDFFRPNFHPWDHDNRRHLARVSQIIADNEARQAGPAKAKVFAIRRRLDAG
ncbi:metal-dependent hydrolase [Burkholderia gladioli]|uniref:metal-dependent hydrolase n=1 Tax=Burkholderia gladioli TaxID=28095 RepID=UPI003F79B982